MVCMSLSMSAIVVRIGRIELKLEDLLVYIYNIASLSLSDLFVPIVVDPFSSRNSALDHLATQTPPLQ
jgi:hypothetical protein